MVSPSRWGEAHHELLSHSVPAPIIYCSILIILSTWLESDKYQFKSNWFITWPDFETARSKSRNLPKKGFCLSDRRKPYKKLSAHFRQYSPNTTHLYPSNKEAYRALTKFCPEPLPLLGPWWVNGATIYKSTPPRHIDYLINKHVHESGDMQSTDLILDRDQHLCLEITTGGDRDMHYTLDTVQTHLSI